MAGTKAKRSMGEALAKSAEVVAFLEEGKSKPVEPAIETIKRAEPTEGSAVPSDEKR